MEFKKAIPFDIHISPSANGGYIVNVGCCTAVYADRRALLGGLAEYLEHPDEVAKEYNAMFAPAASQPCDCEAPQPVPGNLGTQQPTAGCAAENTNNT